MSDSRPWAWVCTRCNHLASVHRGPIGSWPCEMPECHCAGSSLTDFDGRADERTARMFHAAELALLVASL